MRPLWRNTLWLGLAAACFAGGTAFGFYRAAASLSDFAYMQMHSDALEQIRRALPYVAEDPKGPLADYAEINLRSAITRLGVASVDRHWHCNTRERAQLSRAGAWLAKRDEGVYRPREPMFELGLASCKR